LTFLSSQTVNTDPVYWTPYVETGVYAVLQGQLGTGQTIASGTLAATVAQNRASQQLQQEQLAAGLSAGQLLINSTHSGAAWLYHLTSGTTWWLTAPLTLHSIPDGVTSPTLVTTFANLDNYKVYAPVNVQIVQFAPVTSVIGVDAPTGYIYHLNVWTTGGLGFGQMTVGEGVGVYESSMQTSYTRQGACNVTVQDGVSNSYLSITTSASSTCPIQTTAFYGGALVGYDVSIGGGQLGMILDGDLIVDTFVNVVSSVQMGLVYLGTLSATTLDVFGSSSSYIFDGTPIFWGPGKLNANGNGRLLYPSGATGGATTFGDLTGGIEIDGQTKGCIAQPAASAIGVCNTAAGTGANLDTANGATSGCLVALGGGAFCNYGTPW